ncbi:MAG: hypothetical protein A2Z12_08850 [Actinobacteria bacterium RBG_16_68_21]|nr:MAG: hypothetical protein A2Z12_08850 [Actinobacteria bacterium RBG_16_68_21]
MQRIPSGVGRTVFIALLAGGIFGAFLLVTPKLAATRPSVPAASIVGDEAIESSATTIPAATTTTSAPTSTTSTTVTSPAVAAPGAAGEPVVDEWGPMTPEQGYDGTVQLSVYLEGPLGGKEFSVVSDLDTVLWRLHVTNTTDQELWGVFAWLERAGRAPCDNHHLLPHGETDCWITTIAYADDTAAVAWVDAWTTTRRVTDKVVFPYQVLPT